MVWDITPRRQSSRSHNAIANISPRITLTHKSTTLSSSNGPPRPTLLPTPRGCLLNRLRDRPHRPSVMYLNDDELFLGKLVYASSSSPHRGNKPRSASPSAQNIAYPPPPSYSTSNSSRALRSPCHPIAH